MTDGKYLYQPSEAFRPKVCCRKAVSDKQLVVFPRCEIIHPLSEVLKQPWLWTLLYILCRPSLI